MGLRRVSTWSLYAGVGVAALLIVSGWLGKGVVQGTVRSTAGTPVQRAIVRIASAGTTLSSTLTDGSGRFTARVPRGLSATISAEAPGFARGFYGGWQPDEPVARVELTGLWTTFKAHTADIVLLGEGRIHGKVRGIAGAPAAGARVVLMSAAAAARSGATGSLARIDRWESEGEVRLGPVDADAHGNFIVDSVPDGSYYLIAVPPVARSATPSIELAPTYFPSAPTIETARALAVPSGTEVAADIQLVSQAVVTITGKVKTASGEPPQRGLVRVLRDQHGVVRAWGAPAAVDAADGEFRVRATSFCACVIVALSGPPWKRIGVQNPIEVGHLRVDTGASHITGAVLRTQPGATIHGAVDWPGASPTELAALRVFPEALDSRTDWGPLASAQVGPDGRFVLHNIFVPSALRVGGSGDHPALAVNGRMGQAGPATSHDVRLPLTRSDVVGTVSGHDDRGVHAVVVLTALEPRVARAERWLARSNHDGRFRIPGVPPGAYAVSSAAHVPRRADGGLDLNAMDRRARRIHVAPGVTRLMLHADMSTPAHGRASVRP